MSANTGLRPSKPKAGCNKISLREAIWAVLSFPALIVLAAISFYIEIPKNNASCFCCSIIGPSVYIILFCLSPLHCIFPIFLGAFAGFGIITVLAARGEDC